MNSLPVLFIYASQTFKRPKAHKLAKATVFIISLPPVGIENTRRSTTAESFSNVGIHWSSKSSRWQLRSRFGGVMTALGRVVAHSEEEPYVARTPNQSSWLESHPPTKPSFPPMLVTWNHTSLKRTKHRLVYRFGTVSHCIGQVRIRIASRTFRRSRT